MYFFFIRMPDDVACCCLFERYGLVQTVIQFLFIVSLIVVWSQYELKFHVHNRILLSLTTPNAQVTEVFPCFHKYSILFVGIMALFWAIWKKQTKIWVFLVSQSVLNIILYIKCWGLSNIVRRGGGVLKKGHVIKYSREALHALVMPLIRLVSIRLVHASNA